MTKAELHEVLDRPPDSAVDAVAILLGEISEADRPWPGLVRDA